MSAAGAFRAALVERLTGEYDQWAHPHLVETRRDGEFTYYEPDVEAIASRVLAVMGTSAVLVAAERQRQLDVEGWTAEHDDEHDRGELCAAAQSYAFTAQCQAIQRTLYERPLDVSTGVPDVWPSAWDEEWFKPSDDPVRNLVKAGALIAAEIDRLTRQAYREALAR